MKTRGTHPRRSGGPVLRKRQDLAPETAELADRDITTQRLQDDVADRPIVFAADRLQLGTQT